MTSTFRNAPLIEVIADLRWAAKLAIQFPQQQGLPTPPPLSLATNELEEFFIGFGGAIYGTGFHRAERLTPPGMPVPLGQAVVRFKHSSPESGNILYQVGPGMFSTHAIPPYGTWDNFAPFILRGTEALLKARPPADRTLPFLPLMLRYVNAFGPDLTQGRDITTSLSDIFKVELKLPTAITKHIAKNQHYKPHLILNMPLEIGHLNITAGEAVVPPKTEPRVLLDILFSTKEPIQPDIDKLMEGFGRAHLLIHGLFMELTKPIERLMI